MNPPWQSWLLASFVLAGFGRYTAAAIGAVCTAALWWDWNRRNPPR